MKLGIIGDIHAGASYALGTTDPATQLNTRLLDFIHTYDAIIDRFEQEGVEVVIQTGDATDTRNPSPAVISALSKCIKRTLDKGFEMVIVAGNHDQLRASETTTIDFLDHLGLDRLSIFTKPGVKSFKDCHIVLLPYRDRKQLKAETNEQAAQVVKAQIAELTKGLAGTLVCVPHLMIHEAPAGKDGESFSINEIVLPLDTFDGMGLVCAGHIHTAQILKAANPIAMYVGSMEKITFGDRDVPKSTMIVDTNDLANYQIIPTPTRSLFEPSYDYSGDKPYKDGITDRIIKDVNEFLAGNEVKGSIMRLAIKVHDSDTYYINQDRIRDRLLGAGVSCLAGIQLSSTSSRQLRDETINENEDSKKAFKAFVGNLKDSEAIKKRLLKYGEAIIEEVEGK
jgi:DNA repair exonuclease SbcCD nuclease subunit